MLEEIMVEKKASEDQKRIHELISGLNPGHYNMVLTAVKIGCFGVLTSIVKQFPVKLLPHLDWFEKCLKVALKDSQELQNLTLFKTVIDFAGILV